MLFCSPGGDSACVYFGYDPLPTPDFDELAWFRRSPMSGFRCDFISNHRHAPVPFFLIDRISSAMRSAASFASSCSQILMTRQPSSAKRRPVSASRERFASIFSRQNSALLLGQEACSGQPCQKQPSTNTATRAETKTTSATRRGFVINGTCNR